MKTPSLIFHTLGLTFFFFYRKPSFQKLRRGHDKGASSLKLIDFFFFFLWEISDFCLDSSTLTLDSNSIWLFLSFFLFCAASCFCVLKSTVCETRFTKEPRFDRAFVQISARGGAGLCVHVSLDVPEYISCVTISAPSGGSSLLLKLFVQGEKTKLHKSFDTASAECCQRETVVLEMKRGSIRLTPPSPATCVMCLLACHFFFFFFMCRR